MPFDSFNIALGLDPRLTPQQNQEIKRAARRWEEIIVGGLPDINVPGIGIVDDILIGFEISPNSDGLNGNLAVGGPTWFRQDSLGLPVVGSVLLDRADLNNDFYDTVFHEMGHALGFGTLWESKGLIRDKGTNNPDFIGPATVAEFSRIYNIPPTGVPLENKGGPGSRDKHFREDVFGSEMMTSTGKPGIANEPISRLTIASMKDLGYEVSFFTADAFTPNTAFA